MKKPVLKTLPNGLRVLVIEQPQAPTLTTMVLVNVGSDYESKDQNGLSHFLEHLYFKGTLARPSAKIISEELDRIGAISNAFTSEEYTGYWAKGGPEHIDTFLDVLSDIYINSTFPEIDVNKEKGVVIEEINMYEDSPQYLAGREMTSLLYGDQPAGRSIIGTKETVTSFTRESVVTYQQAHCVAENTVVVISGPITTALAVRKVKAVFTGIPTKKKKSKILTRRIRPTTRTRVHSKHTDQAHLSIAFPTVALGHTDLVALRLLSTILGRSMSSRLFVRLREDLGVAYYVSAGQDSLTDRGEFGISAGVDKGRVSEVVGEIMRELVTLKSELVSPEELTKAREYSLGMLRLGLESTDDLANFYGHAAILEQPFRTPEIIKREYTKITPSDLRRVARKFFTKERAHSVLVGPFKDTDLPETLFDSL